MSRENKSTAINPYDLGSQRHKERYGLVLSDWDDEDDGEGSSGHAGGQIESVIPFSEQKSDQYAPLIDEWGQQLTQWVEDKADEFIQLLMEGESKFGAVSTKRKKHKKTREQAADNKNQATASQGHAAGGDLPQHPLLNGQRYDGMSDNDAPLASRSSQDDLFENLAEQIEKNPELKLSPELSNNLKLRIDLYNQQKLENALKSRPALVMDRGMGR